ncbi:efflux RND transporter periplasmic adaptor subunit [Flavisolibacter sp. BT320]|nr:efflux RND transporter periplasmic adaptor subunit [Flavisolibacter longurius]
MKKQRIVRWIFSSLLASIFVSCGSNDKAAQPAPGSVVKDYKVLTIQPRSVVLNAEFPATIEGQQNVEIRPKIDGYMERIFVDEGAAVRRGQRLFQISAPQYAQEVRTARANIAIATADVNAAQMEVNKVRPLVEKGILSRYELQSAQYNLQSRQAALAQAKATLANAQTNLSYTIVTSPVDGVIGSIPYKIGSLVNSNTAEPLTTVSNTGNIYAYFSINEKQALAFSSTTKGKTTQERLRSLPPVSLILADGSEFPNKGRVETATGQINTETGSIRVRATFPNPNGVVRSGSSGIVRIPSPIDTAILVPQKATYEIQGKKFVYLLDTAATVKSVEIAIRDNSGGQYFVVERGIRPGDKIVVEGVGSLREGLKIKPVDVPASDVFRSE